MGVGAVAWRMDHFVSARAVVGSGDATVLLEIRGDSVRVKRRGLPDCFVPLSAAAEVGRFLLAAAPQPAPPPGRPAAVARA